jgi:L-serine dehydratase
MHAREAGLLGSADEADRLMERVLEVLRAEVRATIDAPEPSLGGFLHGQARAVFQAGPVLLGAPLARATAYAMAVLERSAAMGVIVAAPTAGSAGVVPGALLGLAEERGLTDAELAEALWCAAAIGAIVGANASVSGAEGGCQAEVGTASAMAAAALVQIHGGDVATCLDAAALALGNIMGLACDPARGLVEYPCQNRNAIGVANAFTAAQLALAGVRSAAPFDEVVAATAAVGRLLPSALRETAEGGLARCPSVCGDCAECGACA